MNWEELLRQARAALSAKLTERKNRQDALLALRGRVNAGDTTVTAEAVDAAIAARNACDAELDELRTRLTDLEAEQARDAEIDALAQRVTPTGVTLPGNARSIEVTRDERTYHRSNDPRGEMFLRDMALNFIHRGQAGESSARLSRHTEESRVDHANYLQRAVDTGNFVGLTVPQYLTDLFAPAAKAGRHLANVCRHHDLPETGMTAYIGRGTTGTSAGVQAAQGNAVTEQSYDDTLLTIAIQTIAGQQTMSRQSIDRAPGALDITMEDLFRSFHTNLDSTLINQATTGLGAVAPSVTYTDASPTVPEFWPKIIAGAAAIEAALLDQASGDNVVIMHSRRWKWMQAATGNVWPFLGRRDTPTLNTGTSDDSRYASDIRGSLPDGTPVVVDNNIATNLGGGAEDATFIVDPNECHLWEDPNAPLFLRCEQPAAANLQVLFVATGYMAYTFGRYPGATAQVNGTGMTTPTF